MRAWAWLVLLAACGARSGLSIDRESPPPDAAAPDAGYLPFVCRWSSLGVDVELARSNEAITDVQGFVHPDRNVLIAHGLTGASRRGAIVDLTSPPRVVRDLVVEETAGIAGAGDRFLVVRRGTAEWRDLDYELVGSTDLAGNARTAISTVDGTLDFLRSSGGATDVLRLDAATVGGAPVPLFPTLMPPTSFGYVVEASLGRFLVLGDGELVVFHESSGTGFARVDDIPRTRFAVAPDLLFGGVILLRNEPGAPRGLDRVSIDPLRVEELQSLDLLFTTVLSKTLAWSDSDVLFVLQDGSLGYMPFTGTDVRVEPDVVPASAVEAEVVLRHGDVLGGVVYSREEGVESALYFRPLACNR
jgi:hypothetical protein